MKIEVGLTYRTRDGKVAYVTGENDGRSGAYRYEGYCEGFNLCWGENGNYTQSGEHPRDIVSLYVSDEVVEEPEITMKVGGVYLKRNGKEVTVVSISQNAVSYPVSVETPKGNLRFYTLNGVYQIGDVSKRDIVSVVREPVADEPQTVPIVDDSMTELEIAKLKLKQIREALEGAIIPRDESYTCQLAMQIRTLNCKYELAMSELAKLKADFEPEE